MLTKNILKHFITPEAGRGAGPEVIGAREMVLPRITCSTQDTTSCLGNTVEMTVA